MSQAGARGPASPPKPPPAPVIKGVSPRTAQVVPAKGSPPAPTVTPARATAPLAPKAVAQTTAVIAKVVRQPSSPDHPVAPLPPWRSVPDPSADDATPEDTVIDRSPATAAAIRAMQSPSVRAAGPSMPPVDVSFDRASVPAPSPPREDLEARSRAIAEAIAPLQQTIRELLQRIEELERRPVQAAPPALVHAAPAAGMAVPAEPYRQPQPSYPAAISVPAAAAAVVALVPAVVARAPALELAATGRMVDVEIDAGPLDGRRRRRRLAITFTLFLLVVFGALFGALAYSYTPH